jgi:hypothetical protein
MPQIIMLNHAASVNSNRMDARVKANKTKDDVEDTDPVVWNGKRLSEMNSDETSAYYGDCWGA